MHFKAALEMVGDAGVKGPVAALQDIERPIVPGLFPAGGGFFFFKTREHSFIGGMHF
jgi:hypothetical protein